MTVSRNRNDRRMPELRGPWLGQGEPGCEATEFCPEVLETGRRVCGIAFSPDGDEAYFSEYTPGGESANLIQTKMANGVWIKPEAAPFNSEQIDNDIAMSPDGCRLIWRSWRPLPGNTEPEKDVSLWAADRTAGGWEEPFPVECGEERQPAVYPGIAASGTLYFSVCVAGSEYAIARARRESKQYEAPELIITGLTSAADLCVAPDESFLVATIFRLSGFKGQADLHVSFQEADGTWSPLQDLGPKVQSELTEYCPTISADGRKLFFCRIGREDKSVPARTYWIDTRFVGKLKERAL